MPEVRYGGDDGKAVRLEVDPELVAVRVRRGASLREGPVARPEAALLDEMESVLSFPEVGVEVYRRRERASRSPDQLRRELRESPATRFAGSVLVDEQSREPVLYRENLFVKFRDGVDREWCLRILREAAGNRLPVEHYATQRSPVFPGSVEEVPELEGDEHEEDGEEDRHERREP
jgi:hypothetical protein